MPLNTLWTKANIKSGALHQNQADVDHSNPAGSGGEVHNSMSQGTTTAGLQLEQRRLVG